MRRYTFEQASEFSVTCDSNGLSVYVGRIGPSWLSAITTNVTTIFWFVCPIFARVHMQQAACWGRCQGQMEYSLVCDHTGHWYTRTYFIIDSELLYSPWILAAFRSVNHSSTYFGVPVPSLTTTTTTTTSYRVRNNQETLYRILLTQGHKWHLAISMYASITFFERVRNNKHYNSSFTYVYGRTRISQSLFAL